MVDSEGNIPDPGSIADQEQHETDTPEEKQKGRSVLRSILALLGWIIGIFVVLLLLFVIALQTNTGAARFGDFLFGLANPFDNAVTRYETITGNFITGIEIHDLNMYRVADEDTLLMAHADTLRLKYNLLSLLVGKVHVREFYLFDPYLLARQRPDSTWDLLQPFTPDTTVVDTLEQTRLFAFQVDDFQVVNLRLNAWYYPVEEDSVFQVQNTTIVAHNIFIDEEEIIPVDTLFGQFSPAGRVDWVSVQAGGGLLDDRVAIRRLVLNSPESDVLAYGVFDLPGESDSGLDNIDFTLLARPLSFNDIQPFVPSLTGEGAVTLDVELGGSIRRMLVEGEAAFTDGGSAAVSGVLSLGERPVAYDLSGTLRDFDPGVFTTDGDQEIRINADFSVDLQGLTTQVLSGDADAEIFDTQFGEYMVQRGEIAGNFDNGLAQVDVDLSLRGAAFTADGVIRPFDENPNYRFEGRLSQFDIGRFFDNPEMSSDISASFTVQGTGFSETSEIEAELDVARSTVNRSVVEDARLTLKNANGNLDVQGRVLFPDGRFFVDASLRFDEPLDYQIRSGRFEDVDLAALIGAEVESSFTGTFSGRGEGTDMQAATAQGTFHLTGSYYDTYQIESADINAVLDDGSMRVTGDADLQGGSFDVALVTRPFDASPTLRFTDARFQNVNLGLLMDNPNLDTDLTGTAEFALRGFEPETMSLQGRLNLAEARINEQVVNSATIYADLRNGNLDFNADLDLPEGSAELIGTAQPFRDPLTYTIETGQFQNINLAAFTGNPGLESDLTGVVTLSGRGLDPETMFVQGRFDIAPSRINEQQIQSAFVRGELAGGELDFTARLDTPEGEANLAGAANFEGEITTFDIRQGTFEGINLGAITGNPNLTSDLRGTLALTGRGFDPETMTLEGRVDITGGQINEQQINSAFISGTVRNGNLDFNAELNVPEGDAQIAGVADFSGPVLTYNIRQGAFEGLDLGALTGNPDLGTYLTGTFSLNGSGVEPETMNGEGQITLAAGSINRLMIESAVVSGSLQAGTLTFNFQLDVPEGTTELAGTAQPFLEDPTYTINQGTFSGLNLGALLGEPNWDTNLYGEILSLTGQGFDPDSMNLNGRIEFDRSLIDQKILQEGYIEGTIDNGFVQVDANLQFTDGLVRLDLEARPFAEVPSYDASGQLVNINLGELLPSDTLQGYITADFELQGVGTDPETMTLSGLVRVDTARFEGESIRELVADFRFEQGFLRLDTLLLRSSFADITGAGDVAIFDSLRSSDFTFDANIRTLEPIEPYLPVEQLIVENGQIAGRVVGPPGQLRFDVTADIQRLSYQDLQLADFRGSLEGELGPERELNVGDVTGEAGYVSIPGFPLQATQFQATYEDGMLNLSAFFALDTQRDARVTATVDFRPGSEQVLLEDLTVRLDTAVWELLQEATITYGEEYRVSGLLLYSGDQQIAIDGVVDPDGMQNIVLTIEQVRVGAFADLLGYEGLDGVLDGSLDMTGPSSAPDVEGTVFFDVITRGQDLGELRLEVDYDSLRLNLDGLLTNEDQSSLSVEGYIPIDLSFAPADTARIGEGVQFQAARPDDLGEVNLRILADSFSVDIFDPFLNQEDVRDIGGRFSADATVTGTFSSPELAGTLQLARASVSLTQQDVTYSNIDMSSTLSGNAIQINQAVLHSGSGRATAEGTIELPELTLGELDIRANLNNFLAADNEEYRIVASGQVRLEGTTESPIVTGNVAVDQADIFVAEVTAGLDIEVVELPERDLRLIEERFGYEITARDTSTFSFYEAMQLNMNVVLQRNTWLRQTRNPEMAIELTGELDLAKEPYTELRAFGTVDVVPQRSRIDQFNRRFSITSGEIAFNGLLDEIMMDVEAEYRVPARRSGEPEVVITLSLNGPLDDPELTLGSNPSMTYTDIVSYIATGRPAGESLRVSGEDFVQGGAGLAVAQLSGIVEGVAAAELGLDVVEIQHSGLRGAQLVAGKYISEDIFVSISQPVSFSGTSDVPGRNNNTPQITVEYEVIDWLLLRLANQGSAVEFNLLFEYAY